LGESVELFMGTGKSAELSVGDSLIENVGVVEGRGDIGLLDGSRGELLNA